MTDIKILYVAGKGRSGSTLLDNLLGQIAGVFSTGELWHLWEWGLLRSYRCGCGAPIPECRIWSSVLGQVFDDGANFRSQAAEISELQRKVLRWSNSLRLLRQPAPFPTGWNELDRYARVLGSLYVALADLTQARVLVDSSKWPTHPGLLGLVPGIEPYLVHLVRDPRAVTYSYRRHKLWLDRQPGAEMPRFGPLYSSLSWLARNYAAEAVRRKMRSGSARLVRYEDLMANPEQAIGSILAMIGERGGDLDFVNDGSVWLAAHHMVGGNPSRSTSGAVELRPDTEWLEKLGWRDALVTTVLTSPLLGRYGYPLVPGPPTNR